MSKVINYKCDFCERVKTDSCIIITGTIEKAVKKTNGWAYEKLNKQENEEAYHFCNEECLNSFAIFDKEDEEDDGSLVDDNGVPLHELGLEDIEL